MFSFRVGFSLYFLEISFIQKNISEVLYGFFMGWRYDTIVSCYVLLPYILVHHLIVFVPIQFVKKILRTLSSLYLFLIIVFVGFVLVGDFGFYSYFQEHLNILAFGLLEDDTNALIETTGKNYPLKTGFAFFAAFVLITFYYLRRVLTKTIPSRAGFFRRMVSYILFFGLFVGGLRGGYSMMVLSPKYSDFSKHQIINDLSLNGVVTLQRAYKLRSQRSSLSFNMAKAMGYGNDIHKAFSDYIGLDVSSTQREQLVNLLERKTGINEVAAEVKPNVVVLLMESFGAHWMKYNSQEFDFLGDLKQHFDSDILFRNVISGDNGTIGSLMVLGTNIPHREGARFISESRYMRVPLKTASHLPFKNRGYETSFLYGGKLAWRDIGKYFQSQGYNKIEGESHIRANLSLKGRQGTEWGLYDEHLFNHIYKKLESGTQSKFIFALSTTNHPPVEVPKTYRDNHEESSLLIPKDFENRSRRERKLFLERFLTFKYSNEKLAAFISKIKSSKFANNTIVVVTGDHNFWGFMNYRKEESFSKYKVPLYFYIPEKLKPKSYDQNKVAGHEDVMTTLYQLALSNTSFYSFGDDLFGDQQSNALSAAVYANHLGGFIQGKPFLFEQNSLVFKGSDPESLLELKKQYRSTLSVADFFIRSELSVNKANSPKK
jgi:phosphoglycerol transferase MdoB-like AlkP superfamily enzyme